jgi:tRNA pseudouridine55 synthase
MLGAATTSYDAESPILHTGNFDNITREDIEKVLDQFRGVIKQTPPM